MGFWLTFFVWVGFTILGELLRPKPQSNISAAGLEDFQFPIADEGVPLPVIWGKVRVRAPNVIWYGDLKTVAIQKKVKTGLFSSSKVTVGYKYYVGMHLGLCADQIDGITKVWVSETEVWSGGPVVDGPIVINEPNIFGGDEDEGGIVGTYDVMAGGQAQVVNDYLQSVIVDAEGIPAFRSFTSLVWRQGYLGTSPYIKPHSFEVLRYPDGLGSGYHIIGEDANPAEMLYELLTNSDWGLAEPIGQVDGTSFLAAAQTLYNEGFGMSYQWTTLRDTQDIIQDILRHIDGVMYRSPATGLYTLRLTRDDYVVGNLPEFTVSNVVSLDNFSRGAWDETTNEVKVQFQDRASAYNTAVAEAQDIGNWKIQGTLISSTQSYSGIRTASVANMVAMRDLRTLTYPIAKIDISVNREGGLLEPGDVFRLTWAPLGITDMVFRIQRANYGELDKGAVSFSAIQDIFALGSALFANPPATGWVDPVSTAYPVTESYIDEVPYYVAVTDEAYGTDFTQGKAMCLAVAPSGGKSFDIYSRVSPDPYLPIALSAGFTPRGYLDAAITPGATTLTVKNMVAPETLQDLLDPTQRQDLGNFTIIDDEFIVWSTVTDNGNGTYTLGGVWRGVLDTVPKAHSADAVVLFPGYNVEYTEDIHPASTTVNYKLITRTAKAVLSLASATEETLVMSARADRPYPPGNVRVNGQAWPTGYIDTQVTVSWSHRDRTTNTEIVVDHANATSYGPEASVTYTLRIYDENSNLARTVTGLTGTSYTYLEADELADLGFGRLNEVLTIELEADRAGTVSHQYHVITVLRTPIVGGYGDGYGTYYGQRVS